MKHLFALLAVLTIAPCANSQYYQKRNEPQQQNYQPLTVTITLSPIEVHNGKYFFDNRRVKFEEIMLPLISVHDKKIDRKLKVIRTLTDIRRPLGFLPLLYISGRLGVAQTRNSLQTDLYLLWGFIAFTELYDLSIALAKRSTIHRYNDVIVQPSVSSLPNSGINLGLSIRF